MNSIEARPYGPTITDEEREILRSQVKLIEKDIILWKEAPVTSVPQIEIFGEKFTELTRQVGDVYLLIDLTNTNRPNPEILEKLRNMMSKQTRLRHVAVFTGMNFILNVAVKFVLARIGFSSYSIHKTGEEALEALHNAQA